MKKIILLACLGISLSVHAQTNQRIMLSLQQAIDTGLANRFDIQANQYNIHLAKNDLAKSKNAWIPEVEMEGNVQYNTQLQATLIPGGFAGSDKPQLLALGAKDATVFGLTLHQPVYKPGLGSDVKLAENELALKKEINRQNEISVKMQIATAYFNVLLKQLQDQIAVGEAARYDSYFQLVEGKYKQGALIENDYLSAKLNREDAKVQAQMAQQEYNLSIDKLKNVINVSNAEDLILTDSLSGINKGVSATTTGFNRSQNRTEVRQLAIEQSANKLLLTKMRRNALPAISFVANYSEQFLYNDFNYFNSKWWKPFSYVGLEISVPITSNIRNQNNIREVQLKMAQNELDLKQTESDIHFEIQKALTDLENARSNMQSTKNNYELSQTIYKNQQLQLAVGAFQYTDLLDTEKSMHAAEQHYIQAAYDYLVAKINYQKAIGAW